MGDTVRSTTVRSWIYVVLGKRQDGLLDCQQVNGSHSRLTIHPATVELLEKGTLSVSKAESATISPIQTRSIPETEALPTAEEETAIASIQPPEYNPFPIGRKGATANWKAISGAQGY